eukprot:5821312-Pyramimonas_sp.AAC.2
MISGHREQDKNPDNREEAAEVFKMIAEAYETLSDAQKRAEYDQFGKESDRMAGPGTGAGFSGQQNGFHHHYHHVDPFELFREVFGGRDAFDSFFMVRC